MMTNFTVEQQAQHCDQLADLLKRVGSASYNHSSFVDVNEGSPTEDDHSHACGTIACALGWGSIANIGGLQLAHQELAHQAFAEYPYLPDEPLTAEGQFSRTLISADRVFGVGAWANIFDADCSVLEDDDGCDLDDEEAQITDHELAIQRLRNQARDLRAAR